MRKILSGFVVLALSFLFITEWAESLTSSENISETKDTAQKPVEPKPIEPKNNILQPTEVKNARPAPIDPALEEILRIRAENGSPLRGSLLEKLNRSAKAHISDDSDPPPDLFAESLQRVAKETPAAPTSFVDQPSLSDDPPPLLGPAGESEPAPAPETAEDISAVIVSQLRGTSRALDDRANDLEERRRYDDAKRLRKLSDQIRAEARRLDDEAN